MNYFTVDGQATKLGSMELPGFDNRNSAPIKQLKMKMREESDNNSGCDLTFDMGFKIEANVNAVIVKVHEIYE